MIFLLVILFLLALGTVGAGMVAIVLYSRKKVKGRAYELLGQPNPDRRETQKLIGQLSALSAGKDVEAAELVRQLMAKAGGRVVDLVAK